MMRALIENLAGPIEASLRLSWRRWLPFVAVAAIALLGLKLRIYHLDFPSIGMHNMKENEYLSEARFMIRSGDYLRRRVHLAGLEEGDGAFRKARLQGDLPEEYPQIPLVPWIILFSWKVLGEGFWQARLPIVLFSCATFFALFFFARRLSGRTLLALIAVFLLAILPEHVFFGRNIQPESPALFFALLASTCWLRLLDAGRVRDAFLFALFLGVAGLFKYTFLIASIPLFLIALGHDERRNLARAFSRWHWMALGLLPLAGWILLAPLLNERDALFAGTLPRVRPFEIFTVDYWARWGSTLLHFTKLNYSAGVVALFAVGVLVLAFSKTAARMRLFVLGSLLSAVPYAMLLSDYLRGHSYYQFPFLPFVCLGAAAGLVTAGDALAHRLRRPFAVLAPMLVLIPVLPGMLHETDRHWDTIFFGLDVAADYLGRHSQPDERLFVIGPHQAAGVCYNADRMCAFSPTLEEIRRGEDRLGFQWAFVYGTPGLASLRETPERLEHLESQYELRQMSFFRTKDGMSLQTLLLRRGGSSDLLHLERNPIARATQASVRDYDTKSGVLSLVSVAKDETARAQGLP
jgi:4-amino-4-deoxy-L-arabinose transferase-like glycosyltransferase